MCTFILIVFMLFLFFDSFQRTNRGKMVLEQSNGILFTRLAHGHAKLELALIT